MTRTRTNGSAVSFITCLHLYHVTSILHCQWWQFWSRDTEVLYYQLYLLKIKNYQIQTIIEANLSYIGFSGISSFLNWLRILAEYDMLKPTIFFQKFYIYRFSCNFYTFFYQFLETRTLDITLMGIDQLLKCQFSAYTPFHFLVQSL